MNKGANITLLSLVIVGFLIFGIGIVDARAVENDRDGIEIWMSNNPSDDAYVRSGNPGNNFGNGDVLWVEGDPNGGIDSRISLVRFDVDGLPENALIMNAELRLYMHNGPDEGDDQTHSLRGVMEEWDEDSVTWNNKPEYRNDESDSVVVSSGMKDSYIVYDVTSDIGMILNGGLNYGWAVIRSGPGSSLVGYRSSDFGEESVNPVLYVEYENLVEWTMEDLVNLFDNWGDCPAEGECRYDINDDGVVDEMDLNILLDWLIGNGYEWGSSDVNGDRDVNMEDVLSVLLAWGVCEECSEDIFMDGDVNEIDVALVQAFWGMEEGFVFLGEENIVNMGNVLELLNMYGECPAEGECVYDFDGDGDVDELDLRILLEFWGVALPVMGDFEVEIVSPVGTYRSLSNVPIELMLNESEENITDSDYVCEFSILDENMDPVVELTEMENCESTSVDLEDEDNYHVYFVISNSENEYVFPTSEFDIDLPDQNNNNGGGSSSSSGSSRSGSGGGGCLTEWECGEYGECINGVKIRTCEKLRSYCYGGEKPSEVETCEIEAVEGLVSELPDEEDTPGALNAITGAVIAGESGRPTMFGWLLVVLLVVVVYFVIKGMGTGEVEKEEPKPHEKGSNPDASEKKINKKGSLAVGTKRKKSVVKKKTVKKVSKKK